MADADSRPVYTLHYFPFSLCSLMSRLAFVLGERLNPQTAPRLEIRLVNLQCEENLTEKYLLEVHPKGQVPALSSPALPSPITDSREISQWLCAQQPELIPEAHREDIERLIEKLYAFQPLAISVPAEFRSEGVPNQAAAMLETSDISDAHRKALQVKSEFHDATYKTSLEPESVAEAEEKARELVKELEIMLKKSDEDRLWIFGDRPTIADAHAIPMIARMLESRPDLVTEPVARYAKGALASPEWLKTAHGRPTSWNISLGPAAKLNPL